MSVKTILCEIEAGKRLDDDTWNDSNVVVVSDMDNNRIKKHDGYDLSFLSKIGSSGVGNDNFKAPMGICNDGTHLYICDYTNARIVKRLMSDLSYVDEVNTWDGNAFSLIYDICTDNTYLYIINNTATPTSEIVVLSCLDLSYVKNYGVYGNADAQINTPYGICTDGTHLYISDTANHRIKKHTCSDFTYVSKLGGLASGSGDNEFYNPRSICHDGTNLYVADGSNDRIKKHLMSDLSYVAKIGSTGSGDDQFSGIYGIDTDGTSLFTSDTGNDRLMLRLCSDLSYVAKIGSVGSGDDQFANPRYLTAVENSSYWTAHTETPSRVTENGAELTSRATYALCEANAGSWYYDSANSRLYVHTTGSDDPGGGSYIIMSYFWEYIATHAGEYNGHWYYGRLNKENIPSIESSVSGPHEGVVTLSPGSISINNLPIQPATAGFYDSRLSTYVYEGAKIILLRGEQDAAYGTFEAFIHGYLGDWECDEKHFIPQIDDFRKYL